jgi:1,2-dihydroxy-3-keto-5-methylthiopentene dioxygenase
MTLLIRWPVSDPTTELERTGEPDEIAATLHDRGIRYERWSLHDTAGATSNDDVLAAYRDDVDRLIDEGGFTVVDVVQLHPSDDPSWPEVATTARQKFLAEHTHGEDEIRFFVQGAGTFYLHLDDEVVAVLCEAGDLLSVPALTTHWFDMGTAPDFTAIRFFLNADGWVGTFTGDPIASSFADFDQLVASRT